ncbi:glycosyltransferase [Planctomycetales bacterium ZRK34]|nr:glycosyltransferase [Planctomycetales bacterium ZRK34]
MDSNTLPRITVIIPNFNHGTYLERAICSVLDQDYENLEIAIIDGGSCDDSIEVIRRYEDELEWWISTPDSGPAEAVNRGIKHATGELIGVLSSDDVLEPFALMHVAERYLAAGRPEWIISPMTLIDDADAVIEPVRDQMPAKRLAEALLRGQTLDATMSFRRADAYQRYGVFDAGLLHAFEFEYTCRMLAGDAEPVVMDGPLAMRRRHVMSLTAKDPRGCGRERRQITMQYAPAALPSSSARPARRAGSIRRSRKAA